MSTKTCSTCGSPLPCEQHHVEEMPAPNPEDLTLDPLWHYNRVATHGQCPSRWLEAFIRRCVSVEKELAELNVKYEDVKEKYEGMCERMEDGA